MYSVQDTWGYPCEFPHSEIFGSQAMCAYPKLIAAYHVLHRLLMPRHSPCALCSLTYHYHYNLRITSSFHRYDTIYKINSLSLSFTRIFDSKI